MCIYVYEPRVLDYLPEGNCQFPDLVLKLLDAGERVAAFPSDAEWYDIGTTQEYERALEALELRPSAFSLEGPITPMETEIDSAMRLHPQR